MVLLLGGDLLGAKLRRTSGNSLYDGVIERAII
jgi:hypothetical protein